MENAHGKSVFDMDANLVALLCYLGNFVCFLGLILSIITVLQDKRNKLARFHAWQSILLSIVPFVTLIVLFVLIFFGSIIGAIIDSMIGFPIVSLIVMIVSFVFYILAIICSLLLLVGQILGAIKGYNGELFKLPIIGKMADKYSG
ncbi:MAG: hypothetical protein IPM63_08405 [Acidobacteriota bacterium]|nr:MAG: hypothetical protein IPM63_08405 [Acidobacteriota bacterium]